MSERHESRWKWEITNWRWWLLFHLTIACAVLYGPVLGGHIMFWWLAIAAASLLMLIALIVYAPRKHYTNNPASRRASMVIILSGPLLILIYAYTRTLYSVGEATDELKRLCDLNAGLTINRTIHAPGYFDDNSDCSSCWKSIISTDYEYIEFCDANPPRHYGMEGSGCWRASKADKRSPDCNSRITTSLARETGNTSVAEFLKEQCIVTTKIPQPTARSGVYRGTEKWFFNNYHNASFTKFTSKVMLLETKQVLSTFVTYFVSYNPDMQGFFGGDNCGSIANDFTQPANLIEVTVIP